MVGVLGWVRGGGGAMRRKIGLIEGNAKCRHLKNCTDQYFSWVENANMTKCTQDIGYLQSINSDEHLPQSPFRGKFFKWRQHLPTIKWPKTTKFFCSVYVNRTYVWNWTCDEMVKLKHRKCKLCTAVYGHFPYFFLEAAARCKCF